MKVEFRWARGFGRHNHVTEVVEYPNNTAEKEIQKDFEDWVWAQIGDQFSYNVLEEEEE